MRPDTVLSRAPTGPLALPADEVHLWIARCREAAALTDRLVDRLPEEDRARAEGITAVRRREQFVLGRSLLRAALTRYLGEARRNLTLEVLPAGKPVIADPGEALHFNLAHSDDVVALALSGRAPVGLDVERIRPVPQREAIARRWFTEAECRRLAEAAPDPDEDFFRVWTAREARVKATGLGISRGWAAAAGAASALEGWTVLHPSVLDGYTLALAVPGGAPAVRSFAWNPREEER